MNYHFFFSEIYGTTTQCKIKELPGQIIAQMVSASLNLFHITLFFFLLMKLGGYLRFCSAFLFSWEERSFH